MILNLRLRTKWISKNPFNSSHSLLKLDVFENILVKGVSLKPNKWYKDQVYVFYIWYKKTL